MWSLQAGGEVHGASSSSTAPGIRDWLRTHCPQLVMEGLLSSIVLVQIFSVLFYFCPPLFLTSYLILRKKIIIRKSAKQPRPE